MDVIKPVPWTDLAIPGLDVEGYQTSQHVVICDTCYAVVSSDWDHWEKHVAWHLDGLIEEETADG